MTATECPCSSRLWDKVDPTRPQPMITTCTVVLLSPGREPRFDATRQRAWGEAPYDRGCAAAGEADEPVKRCDPKESAESLGRGRTRIARQCYERIDGPYLMHGMPLRSAAWDQPASNGSSSRAVIVESCWEHLA